MTKVGTKNALWNNCLNSSLKLLVSLFLSHQIQPCTIATWKKEPLPLKCTGATYDLRNHPAKMKNTIILGDFLN